MLAKETDNACVEVTVKGRSVEARRIGAKARQVRCNLWRTGRQKSEVTGRHDANVWSARQAIGGSRRVFRIHASPPQFRSPDQQGDLDPCEAFLNKQRVRCSVGKHSGPDSRLVRQVGWNVAAAKLLATPRF